MAKKYHPDSSGTSEKQSAKYAELQEKFVTITKAYHYLRDLSEEEINLNKEKEPSKEVPNNAEHKRRMTA